MATEVVADTESPIRDKPPTTSTPHPRETIAAMAQTLKSHTGVAATDNEARSKEDAHQVTRSSDKILEDLPQELFLEIVNWLRCMPTGDYQKSLYNLCLVKPFNPAATEMLYNGQTLRFTNHLLLRTVLEKPKLGALIQRVHLTRQLSLYRLGQDGDIKKGKVVVSVEDADLFRRAAVRSGVSEGSDGNEWMHHLDIWKYVSGLDALLILHTPNISSLTTSNGGKNRLLDLYFDNEYTSQDWGAPTHHRELLIQSPTLDKFSRLQKVHLPGDVFMSQVASIMRLPALRQLRVKYIDSNNMGSYNDAPCWSPDMFPPASSKITSLEITEGPVHEDALSALIRACSALKHFSYGNARQSDIYHSWDYSMAKVWEALQMHQTTLQSLALHYEGYTCTPIESLVDFTRLEKLGIDAQAVTDETRPALSSFHSLLPLGIEFVRLVGPRVGADFTTAGSLHLNGAETYLTFPLVLRSSDTDDEEAKKVECSENHWRKSVEESVARQCNEFRREPRVVWDWELSDMPV